MIYTFQLSVMKQLTAIAVLLLAVFTDEARMTKNNVQSDAEHRAYATHTGIF